jgi:hypothetical protein
MTGVVMDRQSNRDDKVPPELPQWQSEPMTTSEGVRVGAELAQRKRIEKYRSIQDL